MEILKTILYTDVGSAANNWALFSFRVLMAVELFRVHGLRKFHSADGKPEVVPNPFGLPQSLNNLVATFADTVVPVFLVLGLGTRLAVLPTIGVTLTGYFVVHRKDPIAVRDSPYTYSVILLLVLILGPGTISFDQCLYHILFIN